MSLLRETERRCAARLRRRAKAIGWPICGLRRLGGRRGGRRHVGELTRLRTWSSNAVLGDLLLEGFRRERLEYRALKARAAAVRSNGCVGWQPDVDDVALLAHRDGGRQTILLEEVVPLL